MIPICKEAEGVETAGKEAEPPPDIATTHLPHPPALQGQISSSHTRPGASHRGSTHHLLLPAALPRAKPPALSSRTATCSEIPSTQCFWHHFPLRELPAALAENTVEPNSTSDTPPAASPTLHSSCRAVSGAPAWRGERTAAPRNFPTELGGFYDQEVFLLTNTLRSCSSTSVLQAQASHVDTRRTARCRK